MEIDFDCLSISWWFDGLAGRSGDSKETRKYPRRMLTAEWTVSTKSMYVDDKIEYIHTYI
jgi:hypothetical protein